MAETDTFDPNIYEFDPRPADFVEGDGEGGTAVGIIPDKKERVAVIRTTDRMTFRRCRRRWGWGSHLRGNLGSKEGQSPLWLGSGFHFALEDFHGANIFGHPAEAFKQYIDATKRYNAGGLPPLYREDAELADGMLRYYADTWLRNRDHLATYIYNGVPQVEVNFRVNIPFDEQTLQRWGYDRVVYSGTIDRVIIDEHGQLWIVEYKTAKSIQTLHLANDSQVSSYCWAGQYLYDRPVVGVIYQQHRKDIPQEPKILGSGRLSTDKRQLITHSSLRSHIVNLYGKDNKFWPRDYIDMLNDLAKNESPDADKFIVRSKAERNQHQRQAEGVKIMMEVEEMLNPDLPLYPNPDRTCQHMCPFNTACVSLDDGSDWEYDLELTMKQREASYDSWRKYLRLPNQNPGFQLIEHIPGENSNG